MKHKKIYLRFQVFMADVDHVVVVLIVLCTVKQLNIQKFRRNMIAEYQGGCTGLGGC